MNLIRTPTRMSVLLNRSADIPVGALIRINP